jgi:uncharacterized membrane protein
MLHHHITKKELILAQFALLVAILLQIYTHHIGSNILPGFQYVIIMIELSLAIFIGFTVNMKSERMRYIHHAFAVALLGLITFANIISLVLVLDSLINVQGAINGENLLSAAIAIFLTNIIVFALWYWEIDSPGLTRTLWSKYEKDFQFTQQDLEKEFPKWQPEFGDYMYLSITNAINFAPSDSKPLTQQAKFLMAAQSLISVFTLALVIARSVSILGS